MRIIILFTFLFTCTISAQTKLLDIKIKNKASNANIKNALIIEDKESKALFTFLEEEKTTYGFKHNKSKALESELISEGLKRKYKTIIGSAIDENNVRLIESNKKHSQFASILFDFKNKITEEIIYDFRLSSYDYYLQSYSYENKTYMFTYNSQSNKLCRWTFLIDGSYKQKHFDLEGNYSWVNPSSDNHFYKEFQKINNKLPNNLSITSQLYKMYEYSDGFTWTLNDNSDYTLIIEFKAPEFVPEFSKISNPKIEANAPKSNSYIFEDKIAQVVSNSSHLAVVIKNLTTESTIKSILISKKDTINFKNGPIIQEGSVYSFGSSRKIEKTSKFLRKMSSEKNGISIFPMDDTYRVTIGGIRTQTNSGGIMIMSGFGGMQIGQFGALTMSFNPSGFAYGSYNYTGSTRIECLFDKEFNHINGKINENVFDRVNQYKNKLNSLYADNVFYLDNKIVFGFYQPAIKTYELIQF